MDLWIRSQDRESMFKVQSVFYSINEKNEHLIRTIAIDNVHKGIVKIGHYKTKERVIEVLDEIQDLLQNAYAGNGNRIVYQMPEN